MTHSPPPKVAELRELADPNRDMWLRSAILYAVMLHDRLHGGVPSLGWVTDVLAYARPDWDRVELQDAIAPHLHAQTLAETLAVKQEDV